jgi:hypothetical protein
MPRPAARIDNYRGAFVDSASHTRTGEAFQHYGAEPATRDRRALSATRHPSSDSPPTHDRSNPLERRSVFNRGTGQNPMPR